MTRILVTPGINIVMKCRSWSREVRCGDRVLDCQRWDVWGSDFCSGRFFKAWLDGFQFFDTHHDPLGGVGDNADIGHVVKLPHSLIATARSSKSVSTSFSGR